MDFPSNSQNVVGPKAKKEVSPDDPDGKPKLEKVVGERVILKRKGPLHRFKNLLIGGDMKSVTTYVFGDVLLPALKNMAYDTLSEGGKRLIFGDSGPRRRSGMGGIGLNAFDGRSRVRYDTPVDRSSRRGNLPDQPHLRAPSPRRHDAGEIILYSNEEATQVLERMADVIDKFEVVTVADLYDLVGVPSAYVDNAWGWTSLHNAGIRQVREGYLLDLPVPEPI